MLHLNDGELLADESFINYCLDQNEVDTRKWLAIIQDNPEAADHLKELRHLVTLMSKGIHDAELETQFSALEKRIELSENVAATTIIQKRFDRRALIAAAACLVLIIGTFIYYLLPANSQAIAHPLVYSTKLAEKKSLSLPDGTKVILNAGSKLFVDEGFGEKDRKIRLDGEAFFDVTHDDSKPFFVITSQMDVKVLGTAFNVKAYEADATTETSLIRGSVELSLKEEKKTITLSPNEKYLVRKSSVVTVDPNTSNTSAKQPATGLLPLQVSKEDTAKVEVLWTMDKLVFIDEPFDELAKKLERWYGVTIEIADPSLKNILYTASFRNESLEDVLEALSFTRPFKFEYKNGAIMIYK